MTSKNSDFGKEFSGLILCTKLLCFHHLFMCFHALSLLLCRAGSVPASCWHRPRIPLAASPHRSGSVPPPSWQCPGIVVRASPDRSGSASGRCHVGHDSSSEALSSERLCKKTNRSRGYPGEVLKKRRPDREGASMLCSI